MDLTAFQHSIFLQALGSAILNSLWQGFILWLIYETVSASYKKASAKFKHNLSSVLIFSSFILFISSFILRFLLKETIIAASVVTPVIPENYQPQPVSAIQQILSYGFSALPFLSTAYIFLLFFLMIKLFTAYRYVNIVSGKRLINPPANLKTFTLKIAMQMGITKKISIWISKYIDVPATIGFIKPVILIPVASLSNLSGHQLEAIILHELSHIKRNDYFINLIVSIIETILFFNPFVALLSNVIKRERENCCDDYVLQFQYDPHAYASALLRLEQSRVSTLKLAIGAVSGKKQLLSRIIRITNGTVATRQFNYGQKLLALLLITCVFCSVAWLSPSSQNKSIYKNLSKEVLMDRPARSVNSKKENRLINPDKENLPHSIIKFNTAKHLNANAIKRNDVENILTESLSLAQTTMVAPKNFSRNNNLIVEDRNFEKANFKQPRFLFNDKSNFPAFIKIKNFPFQSMNFDVDLTNLNFNELNKNLQQAYKEISQVDWDNIQSDINKSFSGLKVSQVQGVSPETIYNAKVAALAEIKKFQQSNFQLIKNRLQKKLAQTGSIQNSKIVLLHNSNTQMHLLYKKLNKKLTEEISNNYSFNYDSGKNVPKAKTTMLSRKNYVSSPGNSANVSVLIHNAPAQSQSPGKKQFLQFSFKKDKSQPTRRSVISIEVNE